MSGVQKNSRRQAAAEIEITEEMISAGAEIVVRAHGDAVIEGEYGSLGEREVAQPVDDDVRHRAGEQRLLAQPDRLGPVLVPPAQEADGGVHRPQDRGSAFVLPAPAAQR